MSTRTPGTRTRVGKYELGKKLGEGNFAEVRNCGIIITDFLGSLFTFFSPIFLGNY